MHPLETLAGALATTDISKMDSKKLFCSSLVFPNADVTQQWRSGSARLLYEKIKFGTFDTQPCEYLIVI